MNTGEDNFFDLIDIEHYGRPLATYAGKGDVRFNDGRELPCDFLVGQMTTGDVIALCFFRGDYLIPFPTPVRFTGRSMRGDALESAGAMMEFNYLPMGRHLGTPGTGAAIHIGEIAVTRERQAAPRSLKYGITNFEFVGSELCLDGDNRSLILPLSLQMPGRLDVVHIKPLDQYETTMLRIRTLKSIDITAEAVVDLDDDLDLSRWDVVVEDLCYVLSAARGTKIQWIYCDSYDESGLVGRRHCSRITKAWAPMAPIDAGYDGAGETRHFVESVYPTFVRQKDAFRLKRGIIDSYLDARVEGDYLQTRALKLVVVVEAIKQVYLDQPDSPVRDQVLPQEEFSAAKIATLRRDLRALLSSALKDGGVPPELRKEMYAKIAELFRRPFGDVLADIFEMIGINDGGDLRQFRGSRDCLVHQGRFACQVLSEEEKQRYPALRDKLTEYCFLVHFVDRLLLGMLGYVGPYLDWSQGTAAHRRESVLGNREATDDRS